MELLDLRGQLEDGGLHFVDERLGAVLGALWVRSKDLRDGLRRVDRHDGPAEVGADLGLIIPEKLRMYCFLWMFKTFCS